MARSTVLYTASAALLTAANNWMRPYGRGNDQPSTAPGTEDSGEVVLFPVAGTLRNLRVRARTALTGPGNITYRTRKDGVDQLLEAIVSQGANPHVGSDTVNTVSVSPGESVNMRMMQDQAPTGAGANISAVVEFVTSGNVGFFHWGFGNNLPIRVNGGIPGYGPAVDYGTVPGRHVFRVPRPGYLRGFYVKNGTDFSAGASYEYFIHKNGAPTSITLTIPTNYNDNEDNDFGANSVEVAVGDYIECTCEPDAASATDRMSASVGYFYR